MLIASAPHRITFSGGGTDVADFYRTHGSTILGAAIDLYATVVIAEPIGKTTHRFRLSYSKHEDVDYVDEIEHPIIRAALEELKINRPIHITSIADVPASTGLGTSSAFTVALLAALHRLDGRAVSARYLASQAIYIEREVAALQGGEQDQWWSAIGGLNVINFSGSGVKITKIENRLLHDHINACSYLIPPSVVRKSSDEAEKLNRRVITGDVEGLLKNLKTAKSLKAAICKKNSPSSAKISALNQALKTTWQAKREYTDMGPELQKLDELLSGMNIPMKLCGAGYSGFIYVLANEEQVHTLREQKISLVKISIAKKGVGVIHG